MYGTWFRQNKYGFTLIEKKTHQTFYIIRFQTDKQILTLLRQTDFGIINQKLLWVIGTKMQFISTDKFRFDYKLNGDTLIEFDKMGDQGSFIKIYTDEQKAYKIFNDATFKGEITHVVKVDPSEYFVLNNIDNEFSFTSIPNSNSDNKQFTDLAAIGDTIIKSQFSDTLTLIKKQTKKFYKFGFVRR